MTIYKKVIIIDQTTMVKIKILKKMSESIIFHDTPIHLIMSYNEATETSITGDGLSRFRPTVMKKENQK